MLPIERGLEIVMSTARAKDRPDRMPVESVTLLDSVHRILREESSLMRIRPGSTKRYGTDLQCDSRTLRRFPPRSPIVGESRAGAGSDVEIRSGQCCEIMTGAPLPPGANAVVMVENTQRLSPAQVRILKSARENEGLLRRGAEARMGERILQAGRKIGLADLGLLAGTGKSSVHGFAKASGCCCRDGR